MSTQPKAELEFGFLLADVYRQLRRDFEIRVQDLGLTLTQWRAIARLEREAGMSQARLAELLDVTPITLTRLIDRMEESGWVERRPDPKDRRAVCLHLTTGVRPLLDTMQARAKATQKAAFAGITEKEQKSMLQLLLKAKDNLVAAECARKTASEDRP